MHNKPEIYYCHLYREIENKKFYFFFYTNINKIEKLYKYKKYNGGKKWKMQKR